MAERRGSWPWRRKSMPKADKGSLLSPSQPSSPSSSFKYDDASFSTENGKRERAAAYDIAGDPRYLEVVCLKEEAEERARTLTEDLNKASKEVAAKEAMVKQHEKVAGEAISGWEKAEKEAVSYKQELEAATKQKAILEDRVVHLDGALKDCMKQVRHVIEEQERKIDETILCKTRELEGIKAEVDAKQVELERRIMESDAQNSAMTKSLHERARKIVEANDAKERAETEVKVLQVKLGSCEKELSALKYELHVLNKELEIRNGEVECNKKASDAAHKQHLDNVKKLAKLEADCQRLRNLIRKKLPGPAAIAQMRREVECPQSSVIDTKRRPSRPLTNGTSLKGSASNHRDLELLKDRMASMEEETTLVREALSKRNEELQAARLLCAKTANKLLLAEEQIESLLGTPRDKKVNGFEYSPNREPSNVSASEDEGNPSNVEEASCAESWASALISELALFKKGKPTTMKDARHTGALSEVSSSLEEGVADNLALDQAALPEARKSSIELSENLTKLQELSLLCKDLDCQLTALEELVRIWKPDNEDGAKQVKDSIVSSINAAHHKFSALETAVRRFGNGQLCDTQAPTASKFFTMDPTPMSSLRMVLSKLILLLETATPLCKSAPKNTHIQEPDGSSKQEVGNPMPEAPSHWDQQKQALVSSKDRFLDGKSNVMEFLVRLGIILSEACNMEATDLQEMLVSENAIGASEGSELTDVKAIGYVDELSLVRDQLQQVLEAKADLESTVAFTAQELEEAKAKLGESNGLIVHLQEKAAGLETLGKQLSDQEASKAQLQAKLEAAEVEVIKLQASVATLTLELAEKQQLHENAEAKCKELEQQLQGHLIYEDECNALKVPDSDDTKLAKEHELLSAKEKLAECQRTIFALGKQLSAMSSPPAEISPGGSFDTTSVDSASLMIDRRMQTDIMNGNSMEHHQHHQHHAHHYINNHHHLSTNHYPEGGVGGKYNNGMVPLQYVRRNVAAVPGVSPAWVAESKRRGYEELQEQPLSWSQHQGSFTKRGARISGSLSETDHHHHNQRSSFRPTYVSPSCQYSQRQYEGSSSQLTWTAPSSYPEEEESQLALTVYSPPHTALSSPARSPARYVQQLGGGRGASRSGVRTSLTESMNAVVDASGADFSPVGKPPSSKPSAFGKLFSKSKNHR